MGRPLPVRASFWVVVPHCRLDSCVSRRLLRVPKSIWARPGTTRCASKSCSVLRSMQSIRYCVLGPGKLPDAPWLASYVGEGSEPARGRYLKFRDQDQHATAGDIAGDSPSIRITRARPRGGAQM